MPAIGTGFSTPFRTRPWDREQNFSTIARYTIEETYEVADAIARADMAALKAFARRGANVAIHAVRAITGGESLVEPTRIIERLGHRKAGCRALS